MMSVEFWESNFLPLPMMTTQKLLTFSHLGLGCGREETPSPQILGFACKFTESQKEEKENPNILPLATCLSVQENSSTPFALHCPGLLPLCQDFLANWRIPSSCGELHVELQTLQTFGRLGFFRLVTPDLTPILELIYFSFNLSTPQCLKHT